MKSLLASKWFHQFLGIAISVALLGWILIGMEWSEVIHALSTIDYLAFIPCFAVAILHYYLRAVRWRYLLPTQPSPVTTRTLFDAMMAGNFANYILPLRAGEIIRPMLLARQTEYRFPTAFVSVVIERFFDLATVLLSFSVLLLILDGIPPLVFSGAMGLATLAAALLVVIVLGTYAPQKLHSTALAVSRKIPDGIRTRGMQVVDDLLKGLSVLRQSGNLARVLLYTAGVWITCYLLFMFFLALFNLPLSFEIGTTVAIITALAVAAPSAPGFIGVYELGCVIALGLFGISAEVGTAYALVSHAFHYVVVVGYGAFLLTRYNLRLRELQSSADTASQEI